MCLPDERHHQPHERSFLGVLESHRSHERTHQRQAAASSAVLRWPPAATILYLDHQCVVLSEAPDADRTFLDAVSVLDGIADRLAGGHQHVESLRLAQS